MRALRLEVSPLRFLAGRSLGKVTDAVLFGRLSGLRWSELEPPPPPGPRWVRLRVLLGGICGTDLGVLSFSASPVMEPFVSFPAVPGHEILARVEEVGPDVRGVEPGDRVVVDPVVSCTVRGFGEGERCSSCAVGLPATCERSGEESERGGPGGTLAPGAFIGYHRDLPGGWGEGMVAHESQLHRVPEGIRDRAAVLVEPLSIAVHAVLRSRPVAGPVLVIGSGAIALAVIWALRATGFRERIVAQVKREHEARLARRLGADRTVSPGPEARQALVDTGAQAYMPMWGEEVYAGGGFVTIFDCVGTAGSLRQALRFAGARGRIVLLGCAAEIRRLDLTFVWGRELAVEGSVGYGREKWEGAERHTFEVTMEMLERSGAPVADLVTHVFPLSQYREALSAAMDHRRSGAIKVLLEP